MRVRTLHSDLSRRLVICIPLAAFLCLLWPAREGASENFVFYFPSARHVMPLEVIEKTKYLPLLQVLNLVGKVGGLQEKRNSLKVWFGDVQLDFATNDKRVRVNKVTVVLATPVRVSNGQWMVPVDFLTRVLPRVTSQVVEYQAGANRIFIGGVNPVSFTVRLDPVANGARLTVQFTDKVVVRTAASNGKWIMLLEDQAVLPLEQVYLFQNPYVSELRFDDQDGIPKLILTPTAPGFNFYPVQAEGGKILLADVLKPPPLVVPGSRPAEEQPLPAAAAAPPAPAGVEEAPAGPVSVVLPAVVLDAGHGGQDTGARSRDGVLEKDLTAQLVARLRLSLLATKKYRTVLTRVGDVNPTFEQREIAANQARGAVFLTFHAGHTIERGPCVAVYTYLPPFPTTAEQASGKGAQQWFVPWERVQENHLPRSRQLAELLVQKLSQVPGLAVSKPLQAPVRGLRSVDAPAVAIEVGTLAPDQDAAPLTQPAFQQQIATAIIQALEAFQGGKS